jgi:glutaredoxin
MRRICPHCNYSRQSGDHAPDWQCPSCQRAYEKTPAGSVSAQRTDTVFVQAAPAGFGFGKWLLVVLVLGAAVGFGRPLLQQGTAAHAAVGQLALQPEVILYSTAWCGYCRKAREFFAANGIRYVEYDIEKNAAAFSEHRRLGGKGVPLITVGDDVVKGYNEPVLRELLRPWARG